MILLQCKEEIHNTDRKKEENKMTNKEHEELMKAIRKLHKEVEETREKEREEHKYIDSWAKMYATMIED